MTRHARERDLRGQQQLTNPTPMPNRASNPLQRPTPDELRAWRAYYSLSINAVAHFFNLHRSQWISWERPYGHPRRANPPHYLRLALLEAERHLERPRWIARVMDAADR